MADNRNPVNNTWVAVAGLGLFTVNSGLAIYRSWGDPVSILFVTVSYLALVLLFACLRAYERAPPGSPAGELRTLLTVEFAYKVAAIMPAAVAVVVWAFATTAGGFFALLLFVTVSYLALALLLPYLRAYERAPPGSPAGELRMLLTVGFAYKVAAFMPAVAVVVWGLAFATTAGGFFALLFFVTVSYLAHALLLAYLRAYERAPPGSPDRERARRAAVWPLPTLLAAPRAGGGLPVSAERQVAAALTMAALGVMICDTTLAIHDALGDLCSATLVLVGVAYAAYLALNFRFIRAFAGHAALSTLKTNTMVSLLDVIVLLLCIAFSGLHVLQPLLDYLRAISPRNPIVSATTVAVTLLALCIAYFAAVILVHLRIAPAAPPALASPVARKLFSALACVLLLLLVIMIHAASA
ncbi:unnamed protein product [Urochloa humidicola]